MKLYLASIAAGLLVGIIYGAIGVRSPAPPVIALLGLLGILLGEQLVPLAKKLYNGERVLSFIKRDCSNHVFGKLPTHGPQNKQTG